jgi:hypothetical protein
MATWTSSWRSSRSWTRDSPQASSPRRRRASNARWRQLRRQYSLGRPVAAGGGRDRRHHAHRRSPVAVPRPTRRSSVTVTEDTAIRARAGGSPPPGGPAPCPG